MSSIHPTLIAAPVPAMFHFWIDGHDMRVIEVDGVDVQEYPLEQITLSAAQRVSVLVTARNDTSSNWLIHADMVGLGLVERIITDC